MSISFGETIFAKKFKIPLYQGGDKLQTKEVLRRLEKVMPKSIL